MATSSSSYVLRSRNVSSAAFSRHICQLKSCRSSIDSVVRGSSRRGKQQLVRREEESFAARVVTSALGGDGGNEPNDDWEEIDKLMRELEETDTQVPPSTENTSPQSANAVSGQGEDIGIWDSIDSLIRGEEESLNTESSSSSSNAEQNVDSSPSVAPQEDFQKLTVSQLKEKLRVLGLPVSGRKAVLIERLQSAASSTSLYLDPSSSDTSSMGTQGDTQGFFSSWDDRDGGVGDDLFGMANPGALYGDMVGGGPSMGKPFFADPEPTQVPDPSIEEELLTNLAATSRHYDVITREADYESDLPVNSEQMLKGYESLPEEYTWRGDLNQHPQFRKENTHYQVFTLSKDVDFLVRSQALENVDEADAGRLWLDLSDIYMYHKPTKIYSVPEQTGQMPQEGEGFKEYYAYPVVQWYPGDALKYKEASQEVVKIILVQVKQTDLQQQVEKEVDGQESEIPALAHGEGFELSIDKAFVLDGLDFCVQGVKSDRELNLADYEQCRSGKVGSLSSTRWNSLSFPKPMMLRFNEGNPNEDGVQTFGLCVSQHEGLSTQRWEYMKDPSDVVEEDTQRIASKATKKAYIEKDSPFDFLGKFTSDGIEQEWKELGLDKSAQ